LSATNSGAGAVRADRRGRSIAQRPTQRLDLAGAVWLIGDSEIAAIGPHTIALRSIGAAGPLASRFVSLGI